MLEKGQVSSRAECFAIGFEHNNLRLFIAGGAIERLGQGFDQLRTQRVAFIRSVKGDEADAIFCVVVDHVHLISS